MGEGEKKSIPGNPREGAASKAKSFQALFALGPLGLAGMKELLSNQACLGTRQAQHASSGKLRILTEYLMGRYIEVMEGNMEVLSVGGWFFTCDGPFTRVSHCLMLQPSSDGHACVNSEPGRPLHSIFSGQPQ